ncbi:Uncharacterized protein dnm_063330 [Desulfonema magnum]|uniref:Uncharacterized protein n=1 Tax=Desulfonema magnum TaxID=45655 RepID=A0A975BRU2_9BACT|nr:Uncharacterized protein dnm_063330 [Desulfonema magnum]
MKNPGFSPPVMTVFSDKKPGFSEYKYLCGVMKMSQTGLTIAIPFLFRKFFMT